MENKTKIGVLRTKNKNRKKHQEKRKRERERDKEKVKKKEREREYMVKGDTRNKTERQRRKRRYRAGRLGRKKVPSGRKGRGGQLVRSRLVGCKELDVGIMENTRHILINHERR